MAVQAAQSVLHLLGCSPQLTRCPCLPSCPQVKSLNGQRIMNLKDLVRLVDSCTDKYLHLDLEHNQWVARTARRVMTDEPLLTALCGSTL
jgi:hypothetical protein